MKQLLMLIGRICLSLIFIAAAVNKLFSWDAAVLDMTAHLNRWIASTNFPDVIHGGMTLLSSYAVLLFIIGTIFQGVGGIFVLLGFKVRFGAALLILFLIPSTIIMHPFWLTTEAEKALQMTLFMQNLAILGGLFVLSAKGGDSEK